MASRRPLIWILVSLFIFAGLSAAVTETPVPDLGLFSGHTDIDTPQQAGSVAFDAASGTYTIGGGGVNMWFKRDSFHYVWKKIEGDIALAADIAFAGQGGDPHRKACLMIRESLAADSVYADVAFHGDGLTSLQFREVGGDITREVQTSIKAPHRLRLEKVGDTLYMSLAGVDGELQPSGCSVRLPFKGSFYIGLGVCAHKADAFESAVFSHVQLTPPSQAVTAVRSSLEYIVVASRDRRSVYHSNEVIEAPNWTRDGSALIFNGGGRLYRLPFAGGTKPALIDAGFAVDSNNDHGLSPDGQTLIVSDRSQDGQAHLYTLPLTGGTPKKITPHAPSYWLAWSPDGRTLIYYAERGGKAGLYTMPLAGGEEKILAGTEAQDNGPDYSPDGQWIYFNSARSGHMQIWRMHPDSSGLEQITQDEYNNWYAHPSPDGKWIVFLSYAPGIKGHPADQDVILRLWPTAGGEITVLTKLFGGQGTINAPSWSPDSTKIAYMRYQPAQKK